MKWLLGIPQSGNGRFLLSGMNKRLMDTIGILRNKRDVLHKVESLLDHLQSKVL